MNKIIKNLVLFACLVCALLCSCSNQKESDSGPTVIWAPLHNHERTDHLNFSSLFGSIDTIQLQQAGEESLLGVINDIKCKDDTLFLCSNQAIYLFKTNGEFINSINRRGRGPGEYVSIAQFDIDPKEREIVILEQNGLRKFYVYSFEGKFLRQIEVSDFVDDFVLLSNGDYLCYSPRNLKPSKRGLWQLDSEGNLKKQLVELDDNFKYYVYLSRYMVHLNENQIGLMGSEEYDYFYQITEDTVITSFKMKTDTKIPEKYKRTKDFPESDKAYYKIEYLETDGLLYFELMNGNDDLVQVFYDKNSRKTWRCYEEDINSIKSPEEIIPWMCSSYKGKIYYYYDAATILNNDYYKLLFPNVTQNSNPVLLVCNPK